MWRAIDQNHFLSPHVPRDKAAFLEHFKEKAIHDWTKRIPYPYTESDADAFLNRVARRQEELGVELDWAIRDKHAMLIGGIGFHEMVPNESTEAEIGYWLAKPYWGRGIMTAAVKKIVAVGFLELALDRITATIFDGNTASARVLEKAGFKLETTLTAYYEKDGRTVDGHRYAILYEG